MTDMETWAEQVVRDCLAEAGDDAEAGYLAAEYILSTQPVPSVLMAVHHAPAGGATIGGKEFTGGEFIPGDSWNDATKEEKAHVEGRGPAPSKLNRHEKNGRKFETFTNPSRLQVKQWLKNSKGYGYLHGLVDDAGNVHLWDMSEVDMDHNAMSSHLFQERGDQAKKFTVMAGKDGSVKVHTYEGKDRSDEGIFKWAEREGMVALALSIDAFLAHDVHNRREQGILNKSIKAAKELGAAARRGLVAALKSDQSGVGEAVMKWLETYRLQLAKLLSATQLASLLEGAREVAAKVPTVATFPGAVPPPPSLEPQEATALVDRLAAMDAQSRAEAVYALPADQHVYVQQALAAKDAGGAPPTFAPTPPPAGSPEEIHFPTIDEAVKQLVAKNVMTRDQFDELDAATRAKAFTVANVDAQETLEKIRDSLAENIREGADYETWKQKVVADVEPDTFLSEGHQETVFRTAVQTQFSDGQQTILNHPFVRSGFPYSTIDPIDDDRVEDTHLAMRTNGIGGTNVYRIDDPVFQLFRPPWRWSCRCGWTPLTVRQAAEAGIAEAQTWLETGVEPSPPAFVKMPDFQPPPGFRRAVASAPMSVRLSMESIATFAHDVSAEKRDGGGRFTKDSDSADDSVGTVSKWSNLFKRMPGHVVARAKEKVVGKYRKLEARYGRKYALVIVGAGIAGLPIPVPGSSFITAAPVIIAAELHRRLSAKVDASLGADSRGKGEDAERYDLITDILVELFGDKAPEAAKKMLGGDDTSVPLATATAAPPVASNVYHGPNPPSPTGWVQIGVGPHGGKMWAPVGSPQAAAAQPNPQRAASPTAAPSSTPTTTTNYAARFARATTVHNAVMAKLNAGQALTPAEKSALAANLSVMTIPQLRTLHTALGGTGTLTGDRVAVSRVVRSILTGQPPVQAAPPAAPPTPQTPAPTTQPAPAPVPPVAPPAAPAASRASRRIRKATTPTPAPTPNVLAASAATVLPGKKASAGDKWNVEPVVAKGLLSLGVDAETAIRRGMQSAILQAIAPDTDGTVHHGDIDYALKNLWTQQTNKLIPPQFGRGGSNGPSPNLPDDTRPTLTTDEQVAAQKYTGSAFAPLNADLRSSGGPPAQFGKMHADLQSAFGKAVPLSAPVDVVRGLNIKSRAELNKLIKGFQTAQTGGGPYTMKGYTSTTVGSKLDPYFQGNVTLRIKAVHGLDLKPHTHYTHTSEMLLNHGSQFKVGSVRKVGSKWEVDLEQVPPASHTAPAVPAAAPAVPAGPKMFDKPHRSSAVKDYLTGKDNHVLFSGRYGGSEDTMLTSIIKEAGRDGKPKVLDSTGMDALKAKGWKMAYRSVKQKRQTSQFKTGDYYIGSGIYGNGTYVADGDDEDSSKRHVQTYGKHTMRMAIDPTANIVKKTVLEAEQKKERARMRGALAAGKITQPDYNKMVQVIEDLGRFAALKNYDAIDTENGLNYMVVLNRNKVAVQKDDVK